MGNDSCVWSNSGQTRICTVCGYKTVYKRSHTDDTSHIYTRVDAKWHYYKCTYCNSYGSYTESCRDADGNLILCDGGTCATCGYTYGEQHTWFNSGSGESGTVKCGKCGAELLKYDNNVYTWTSANTVNCSVRITWWNKDIFGEDAATVASNMGMGGPGGGVTGTTSDFKAYASGGYVYASCTVTFEYQERGATWANQCFYVSQYSTRIFSPITYGKIENEAPTVTSASLSYGSKTGNYSTKATLSVTCTDNWNYDPNYVQIRLLDADKQPLSAWITCTRNDATYSQTIDVVTEVTGSKTYYVEARDAGGNTSQKAVTVSNLDSKAPTVTSALVTSQDWSKLKTITFTCIDAGIGDVSIAFNDQSDYQKADYADGTYSRAYTFTGDVYGSVKAAVYFKDALGNVTTEFVEIYNLDNTEPTVSMTDISDAFNSKGEAIGWKVNITGDDANTHVGQQGSGVTKYAISKTTRQPADSSFVANPSLLLTHSGQYYIWVMDEAGNVTMSEDRITIHSDVTVNGKEISSGTYNGTKLGYFYYNGVRLRL